MRKKNYSGSILIVTLFILAIILISALSLAQVSIRERQASIGSSKTGIAYQTSDAAVETVLNAILKSNEASGASNDSSGTLAITSVLGASKVPGFTCDSDGNLTSTDGSMTVQLLDDTGIEVDSATTTPGCLSSSDISQIAKVKAVGSDPGNSSQRAIAASVNQQPPALKLLLHMDGANGATTFEDSSREHHVITQGFSDTVRVNTGESPVRDMSEPHCGVTYDFIPDRQGSALFRSANPMYLRIDNSEDWNFGQKDFLVDFWVKFNDVNASDDQTIVVQRTDNNNYWRISLRGADHKLVFESKSSTGGLNNFTLAEGDGVSSPPGWENDNWYHVSLLRQKASSGSTDHWYLNRCGIDDCGACAALAVKDVSVSGGNNAVGNNVNPLRIGIERTTGTPANPFGGYIDEFRIMSDDSLKNIADTDWQ